MTEIKKENPPIGLELKALQTGYWHRGGAKVVSDCLNAQISRGSLTMLLGPNGSGKSTLLHTIAGLQDSLSGEIYIEGISLTALRMGDRAKLLSLVLTEKIMSDIMTVREVVRIGRYPHIGYMGRLGERDELIVLDAMSACRLQGMEDRPLSTLSDGERQRVMVARALAQDTPLILLDEPTAHLDLPTRIEIILMLKELAGQRGRTILLSTHELDLALNWSDTIWLMNKRGQMYCGGSEEMITRGYLEETFGNDWLTYDAKARSFVIRKSIHEDI